MSVANDRLVAALLWMIRVHAHCSVSSTRGVMRMGNEAIDAICGCSINCGSTCLGKGAAKVCVKKQREKWFKKIDYKFTGKTNNKITSKKGVQEELACPQIHAPQSVSSDSECPAIANDPPEHSPKADCIFRFVKSFLEFLSFFKLIEFMCLHSLWVPICWATSNRTELDRKAHQVRAHQAPTTQVSRISCPEIPNAKHSAERLNVRELHNKRDENLITILSYIAYG